MKFRLLIIMIICWLVSFGNGSTKETDKIVDHIDGVIENNDYTIIYFGAHWCGPCISGFKNKMIDIIDENYDNVETVVIFFDSGNVIQNNETIMKYSPILLQSLSGVDKIRVNGILKKLFKNPERINYMPVMILCDKEKNIINYDADSKRYRQFGKNYIDEILKSE